MLWTLLAAGGLVSIPVLIHIFNRTRYRRIQWAAMDFLLAAYKRTRRRMQFENLLLLILRIMAMLFLALAFIPDGIITATDEALDSMDLHLAETSERASTQHLVVVVDDSASMRYLSGDSNKSNAYDKALEHAKRYIDALNRRRDKVTLIFPSSQSFAEGSDENEGSSVSIRELTPETALATLDAHKATFGRADLLNTFKTVSAKVANTAATGETPRVVVISDFQANEWAFTNSDNPEHNRFKSILEELDLTLRESSSKMVMINALSRDTSSRTNVGIVNLELKTDIVGVGMPVEITASVTHSTGDESAPPLDVILEYQLDSTGIRHFDSPISIPAGETIEVTQMIGRFNLPGAHRVMVRVANAGKDRFPEDNQANLALTALSEVPILVIDGDPPSSEQPIGEVDIFTIALQISTNEDEEGNVKERYTPNKVTVIQPKGLNAAVLKRASVIVLANVEKLTPSEIKLLEDRVSAGGASLFISLGDKIDANSFNANLWKKGLGLAPAQLGEVRTFNDEVEDGKMAPLSKFVFNDTSATSMIKNLGGENAEIFADVPGLAKWYATKLPQEFPELAKTLPPAKLVMSVSDAKQSPLLMTRPYGRGMVAMWTSSIGLGWNEFWKGDIAPLFKISLDSVAYLSGVDSRGRSLRVGDRIVQDVPLHPAGYVMNAPMEGDSSVSQTELDKTSVRVLFEETYTPGVYTLKPTDGQSSSPDSTHYFSVGMPREESNTRPLGKDVDSSKAIANALSTLTKPYEAIEFETKERSSAEIAGSQGDREMDRWLLFLGLALLCLLGEIVVTMITGRRREA